MINEDEKVEVQESRGHQPRPLTPLQAYRYRLLITTAPIVAFALIQSAKKPTATLTAPES